MTVTGHCYGQLWASLGGRLPISEELVVLAECAAGVHEYSPSMTYGVRDFGARRTELCDECGFDGRNARAERDDIRAAFAALQQLTTHTDAGRRPAPRPGLPLNTRLIR